MPVETTVFIAVVVAAFLAIGFTLAWAQRRTVPNK